MNKPIEQIKRELREKPAMGINVKSDTKAGLRYADLIVDGRKTLESRNSDTLRPYVGKRVSIVRTGEGPAKAIGEVTIGEPTVVNKNKFRSMEPHHMVPQGSQFDISASTKHLYPMHDPVRYETERDVGHGIIARKVIHKAGGGPVLPIGPPADVAAKLAALKEQMRQQGTNFDRRMQGVVNAEKTAGTGVTLPTDKAKGGLAHMDKGGQYPYAQAHEQARINAIKMLGLHEHNTAQDRAEAMGINTDAYHGSKQDIRGGYQPGYDDNLAFVTPDSEFANNWIGKGKHNERIGDETKAERKAAENMYKDIKFKHMDYDELNKLEGDKFYNEYDRRNAIVKAKAKKEFGLRGTPDAIHSTVYPMKVRANKTFNPETDMHDMSDFFVKHGIPQKNIDLYKTGNYLMYETKPVVNYLKSKGYDSMRLRESTDDNYPTIAVFDPKHVRSRFAAFDPARQHENDLLAKRGGRVTHAHHLDIEERPL